jgi:hypothetical protein
LEAPFDTGGSVQLANNQQEITVVRDQHTAIVIPVASDLGAVSGIGGLLSDGLDFNDTP